MRRKEREVTDYNKMIEMLKSCDCCRIGLVDDKGAYIVPMNFGYEDNNGKLTLYFHGATEGKKIDLINNQPEISFETGTLKLKDLIKSCTTIQVNPIMNLTKTCLNARLS